MLNEPTIERFLRRSAVCRKDHELITSIIAGISFDLSKRVEPNTEEVGR